MDGMFAGRYGRKEEGAPASPPEKEIENLGRQLKAATEQVKGFAEDVHREMKSLGKMTEETKAKTDEALAQLGEITARLTEAEQKLARRGGGASAEPEQKSMGQHVVDHPDIKSGKMNGAFRGSVRIQMSQKDILSVPATWGATASVSSSLVSADNRGLVVPLPMRQLTIRDLLLQGQTASNAIEYAVQTGFTNNAAPVAEGATKPKSDIAFDLRSAPVRTIAHIFKASRQIMDDAPQLRTFIDGQARYGLRLREEQQLLTGSGTGQNILGIIPQATAAAVPAGLTVNNPIDRLRAAILQAALSEFPASGIVLNPVDWTAMEITKDTQGRYLFGDPQGVATPRLWGLPVVATIAMAQDTFLVGAFNIGAQIFDRMEIEVLLSTENADDFERNMVTIRAEERLALAVYRPEAFITGDLTPA